MTERVIQRSVAAPESHLPVTIIEPPKGWPGLGLGELWRLRRLCLVLTRRNLKVRYRQTVIGAGWSLIQPVLLTIVFTIFFGLLGRGLTDGLAFPVFYLLGLIPNQMLTKMLNEGTTSVVSNATLISRVFFPRAYLPMSVALAALIDLAIGLIPIAALMVIFHIVPGPNIIFAPLLIFIAWVAGLGLSLLLSSLNVAFRDIAQLLPFVTQLLMFLSPIIYPSSIIPEPYRTLYFLNPAALVVEGFRWSLTNSPPPPAYAWVLGPLVAAILLVVGYTVFKRREPTFADYV